MTAEAKWGALVQLAELALLGAFGRSRRMREKSSAGSWR